jgi:UDP-N-acetyl-D-glucosamine dehydrogenase
MPYFCAERVSQALNEVRKPVRGSRVLVLGVSYKPDVGDVRESPALKLIELLGGLGAEISYHDPFVPDLREQGLDLRSVDLDDGTVAAADIVCVVTAHSGIDYADLAGRARLVFDFRNVVPRIDGRVHTL